MLKVVYDTNVYVSAFITPGGMGEEAYLLGVRGEVEVYTSVSILTELAKKLREKFFWEDEKVTLALKHISRITKVLKPKIYIHILQDEPDNRILECAVEARSDLIVTGDKHLLSLKVYEGIRIVKLRDFLNTQSLYP